jgi:hypothetical protein
LTPLRRRERTESGTRNKLVLLGFEVIMPESPTMKSLRPLLLSILAAPLPGSADVAYSPRDDVPPLTRTAIETLRVGMPEHDLVALMRPLSLDSGRVTFGGTGSGRLYFQVSKTQQIWADIDGTKGFAVFAIGKPEPLGAWKSDVVASPGVKPVSSGKR